MWCNQFYLYMKSYLPRLPSFIGSLATIFGQKHLGWNLFCLVCLCITVHLGLPIHFEWLGLRVRLGSTCSDPRQVKITRSVHLMCYHLARLSRLLVGSRLYYWGHSSGFQHRLDFQNYSSCSERFLLVRSLQRLVFLGTHWLIIIVN